MHANMFMKDETLKYQLHCTKIEEFTIRSHVNDTFAKNKEYY